MRILFLALACGVLGVACDKSATKSGGDGGDRDLSASVDDGGTPDGGGGGDLAYAGDMAWLPAACVQGLTSFTLSTASTMVTLTGAATTVSFTATGSFADGHTGPIDPSRLGWKVERSDDTPPGSIATGVLTPYDKAGGTVTVTASDGCVSATLMVTFKLVVTVGTPSDTGAWSGTPMTGTGAPTIVYPSDQTRFPRNIYRTLFQWRTAGMSEFRLTFEGPGSTVVVFTNGAHMLCMGKTPAAGCWEADESGWASIAGSNAGGTVTFTLDGLDRSGATPVVRRAAPITIGFSRRDVVGAIFYWSTTVAGVRRANIRDAVPENYIAAGTAYTNPTDTVKCVACHVVSRDGRYLAAPVQSALTQSLWITGVTATPPPTPIVKSVANTMGHGFGTFSPDDKYVVAAWGGKLWELDGATGSYMMDLPLGTVKGTQPDWSPDNTQLVFASAAGDAPAGASLMLTAYNNPGWGTPKMLAAASGLSNLFPMFSPDGKYVAYSRGKGGHGDLTAQLFVVPAAGGTPVELINANRVVNNQPASMAASQTENNQPTWAPPGDLNWVAFNSKRSYGVVSAGGTQQIWVAAVDTSKIGSGDPSYPAFRLQFQGLTENNHRAFWTLDVRESMSPDGGVGPAPDMARMCVASGATCVPGLDWCCDASYLCDSADNGQTYSCILNSIP
jgi:hypothetical protein